MESSIKFDTLKLEWSTKYIEGLQVTIFFFWRLILSLLANSADPDEMAPYAAFHLGLHCLTSSYLFKGFPVLKWLISQFWDTITSNVSINN